MKYRETEPEQQSRVQDAIDLILFLIVAAMIILALSLDYPR